MTPLERYQWQRKNRRVLYAVSAAVVVVVAVLQIFKGVM